MMYMIFLEKKYLAGHQKIKVTNFSMHLTNWLPMSMTVVRSDLQGVRDMPLIRSRQDYAYWLTLFNKNKHLKCGIIHEALGGYTKQKKIPILK